MLQTVRHRVGEEQPFGLCHTRHPPLHPPRTVPLFQRKRFAATSPAAELLVSGKYFLVSRQGAGSMSVVAQDKNWSVAEGAVWHTQLTGCLLAPVW